MVPTQVQQGVFFHFSKAIHRKVDSVGWRQKYAEDAAFRRRVVALSTLAYLPLDFVTRAFDLLQREFPLTERSIVEYFESTYIGTDRRTSTHPNVVPCRAVFPPSFWNVSARQQLGLPTTTNALERFHLAQQHFLHHYVHPSVPVFVHDLHRQIAQGDLHLAAIQSGERRLPSIVLRREKRKNSLPFLCR